MAAVRIAVVGAGLIGRKHIEVLRAGNPEYVLCGVADPSPAAAAEGRRLGYRVFADLAQMLEAEKPEGAIIAVPNQLHEPAGLACLARGVAILVEKPVADTVDAALRLVDAAAAARLPMLVGHHRRHNPIMRKATEIVRGGGVGKVVAVHGMWLNHKPRGYYDVAWRREKGGGPILINAIHDIDCLRMLCGDVETVQAMSANAARGFPVEDTAAAVLRFRSGALGTLLVSDAVSAPWAWEWGSRENPLRPHDTEDCFLVAGTRGSLAVPTLAHRWHEPGQEDWNVELVRRNVHVVLADAYHEQMRNFARAIRGTEEPVLDGIGGTRTLATTLAIAESARTGAPVDVARFMGRD